MLFAALLSLATTSPAPAADPASFQSVGWLLLAFAALAGAINQILGVFEKLKGMKTPDPGSVSADRVAALEHRVHQVELNIAGKMGEISSKFESISSTLTNLQSDWNYAIGKIDGRTEAQAKND